MSLHTPITIAATYLTFDYFYFYTSLRFLHILKLISSQTTKLKYKLISSLCWLFWFLHIFKLISSAKTKLENKLISLTPLMRFCAVAAIQGNHPVPEINFGLILILIWSWSTKSFICNMYHRLSRCGMKITKAKQMTSSKLPRRFSTDTNTDF